MQFHSGKPHTFPGYLGKWGGIKISNLAVKVLIILEAFFNCQHLKAEKGDFSNNTIIWRTIWVKLFLERVYVEKK